MKFLSKITCIIFALGLVVALSSCKDDDNGCYKCDEFTISGYTFPETTICEGDDNGNGGTYTAAELEAEVEAFESAGGNCDKQ